MSGINEKNFGSEDDQTTNAWELMEHIRSGWRWVVTGSLTGLLLAIIFVLWSPTHYEASAIIQPATVGIASTTTTATTVEPVAQTIERLKLVTFYDKEIVKSCQAESAKAVTAFVKVSIVKGNNLFSLGYRAKSGAEAETCLAKIVEQLAQTQAAIATPLIRELEDQQAETKRQIKDAEQFLAHNEKELSLVSNGSVLLTLRRDELMKLQKSYREQRILLAAPFTQPMKLLAPIYAVETTEGAKKALVIACSLIGGLLVGLFALFANRSWKRYKSANE